MDGCPVIYGKLSKKSKKYRPDKSENTVRFNMDALPKLCNWCVLIWKLYKIDRYKILFDLMYNDVRR